jgi:hypothetical protein
MLRLGREAVLRRGSVIYPGSNIGDRFETGHHVVVREECAVGDDVSVNARTSLPNLAIDEDEGTTFAPRAPASGQRCCHEERLTATVCRARDGSPPRGRESSR